MSAESAAYSHAHEFRWWQGNPDLDPTEAEVRDLEALRDAVADLLEQARGELGDAR